MLEPRQRYVLEAVVQVLAVAGIEPWFEARLIKDSSKKLNGKRISSKTKTDLASVLKVADEKRVNMLPNYRMELRMYATVGASRTVFMGVEQVDEDPFGPDEVREVSDEARALLPPKLVESEKVVLTPKGEPIRRTLPVLGVLNVDNPRDPRHKDWSTPAAESEPSVLIGIDPARPGEDCTVVVVRQDGQMEELRERVKEGSITDAAAAISATLITGTANYIPAKNVERLIAEGASEALIRHAQDRHTIKGMPANPAAPLATARVVADHTCDADGPMRQQDSDGPFLTTCSLCGGFHAGST